MTEIQTIADVTRCIALVVLVLLCLRIGGFIFNNEKTKKYDNWLRNNLKTIYHFHAPALYLAFHLSEGVAYSSDSSLSRNPFVEIIFNIFFIPLAILLYDGGAIHTTGIKDALLANMHHLGAIIALPYHIYESNPMIASRNTKVFAWIWFPHSFSFLQTYIFPVFGIKKGKEQDKSKILSMMRYAYAMRTIALVYSYFNDEGQPGIGWNYQTASLTSLLIGRHALNMGTVDWMRYIEIPGTVFVYCTAICGHNARIGLVTTAALYLGCWVRSVWKQEERPSKWDPKQPEVARILSKHEKRFFSEFPDGLSEGISASPTKSVDAVKSWCTTHPEYEKEYPVIWCICLNDVQRLEDLIQKGADPHEVLFGVVTPVDIAVPFGRLHCAMILLKAGVDPWEKYGQNSVWGHAKKESIVPLLELKKELEPAAFEAYPPIVQESILERCRKRISQLFQKKHN